MGQEIVAGERVKFSKFVFMVLSWGMVACIVLQTMLAGMAIFDDPDHWSQHEMFVHFFEFLPLLMLIFAFTGKMPKGTKWSCLAIFVMIYLQYMTAHLPKAGAFHPVMALALIVLALHVALNASKRSGRRDAQALL